MRLGTGDDSILFGACHVEGIERTRGVSGNHLNNSWLSQRVRSVRDQEERPGVESCAVACGRGRRWAPHLLWSLPRPSFSPDSCRDGAGCVRLVIWLHCNPLQCLWRKVGLDCRQKPESKSMAGLAAQPAGVSRLQGRHPATPFDGRFSARGLGPPLTAGLSRTYVGRWAFPLPKRAILRRLVDSDTANRRAPARL